MMRGSDPTPLCRAIRLKEAYGIFVRNADEVEFRTGSLSGAACVVSDPERRGLLGPVFERLLVLEPEQRRPWNDAESELLDEVVPELEASGIIEIDGAGAADPDAGRRFSAPLLAKPLAEARIAIVGHGVLGQAVRAFLANIPCGSVTLIESSSVSPAAGAPGSARPLPPAPWTAPPDRLRARPQDTDEWGVVFGDHDWVVAAQDCFEPEELAALNRAALQQSRPWSLVCCDGYEGWVGPTFVPGQTACFGCFQRRLLAGAAEPSHVFMDPRVRVCRVPAPWSVGPETSAWVSLITSMFALELIAASQGRSFTINNFLVVHRLNMTFQRESVLRLPRCPDCSPQGDGPVANVFSQVLPARSGTARSTR